MLVQHVTNAWRRNITRADSVEEHRDCNDEIQTDCFIYQYWSYSGTQQ